MTLHQAQETVMPWGIHYRKTLREINATDRTYLTEYLASIRGALDAWLREAVDLLIAEGAPGALSDAGQGQLFGSDQGNSSGDGEQSTRGNHDE
jgi:hypothetical protein